MTKIKQPKRPSNNATKQKTTTPKKKTIKKPRMRQAYGTSKLEAYFATEFLDKLGLNYIYEYEAKDIKRFYDFAIVAVPEETQPIYEEKHGVKCIDYMKNTVRTLFLIEVDGNFYHPDTKKVKWDELSPMQKHNAMVDKIKNEWCVKHRIPLLRFWESDIRNNPSMVLKELKEMLDKLSKRDQIKAGLNRPHPRQ